jgi:DNA-binding PadR family transcriptional regulator
MDNVLLNNLVVELRRGTLILSVVSFLSTQQYGYLVLDELKNKGIKVEASTLYPLLRRLEVQGLLNSHWDLTDGRPKRYYVLSDKGKETLRYLKSEWQNLVLEVEKVMEDSK